MRIDHDCKGTRNRGSLEVYALAGPAVTDGLYLSVEDRDGGDFRSWEVGVCPFCLENPFDLPVRHLADPNRDAWTVRWEHGLENLDPHEEADHV